MKRSTVTWSFSLPKPLAVKAGKYLRLQKRSRSSIMAEALTQYLVIWGGMEVDKGERPAKVPKGQEWIWTPEIQAKIRKAMKEFHEGKGKAFDNVDDLLNELHS